MQSSHKELEKAQKQAWRFYKKWQAKRPYPYSQALKCEVRVTQKGWAHLVGNKRITKRTPQDTIHRYSLLPYVADIIETGSMAGERAGGFVFLQKRYKEKLYRVVLGVDEKKNFTFISIIDVT